MKWTRENTRVDYLYLAKYGNWEFRIHKNYAERLARLFLYERWVCDAKYLGSMDNNFLHEVIKSKDLKTVKQLIEEKVRLGKFTSTGIHLID